jgi:hypothetical protein
MTNTYKTSYKGRSRNNLVSLLTEEDDDLQMEVKKFNPAQIKYEKFKKRSTNNKG